jgi:hypothetical protein
MNGAALAIACFVAVGPLGAAAAQVAQTATPASSQAPAGATTGTVTGTVRDSGGAPVPNARVSATGPSAAATYTDAQGGFSLTLRPGIYAIDVAKAGFGPASESGYAVLGGASQSVGITLSPISFETIKEIGRVTVTGAARTFNTSAASVSSISQAAFLDQGQLQVQHVLDETPGIVADHPGTSANNSSPGNITFPSVRGGLGFETASLIDGHPLAVMDYGDYVTTFLSPYVLQDVEVVKGPGATLPVNYNAINGAVNFHTLDPTHKLVVRIDQGVDGYGGLNSNYRVSDTILNNKLGFVFDFATSGTPGPLQTSNFATLPSNGSSFLGNSSGTGIPIPTTVKTPTTGVGGTANPGVINNPPASTSLVYCCENFTSTYNNKTELAKIRYGFSDATALTFTYLGSQSWTDQNGNHGYNYNMPFLPGPSYSGVSPNGVTAGSVVNTYQNGYPFPYYEINNEPMFQGELRTTYHGDTILARYYGASINRLQYDGAFGDITVPLQLWGTFTTGTGGSAVTHTYNGQMVNVTFPASYSEYQNAEQDTLHGGSVEYDHFFGKSNNNLLTLAYDQTAARSNTYSLYDNATTANPNVPVLSYSYSVFPGSWLIYRTYKASVSLRPTEKLNVILSNYLDSFTQHVTLDGGNTWLQNGHVQDDPRIGVTYRANPGVSLRASAGASLAPPYLALIENGPASYSLSADSTYVSTTQQTGKVLPETSFGYDLGADLRLGADRQTILSTDLYLTNVKNQFVSSAAFLNGNLTFCPPSSGTKVTPAVTCPGGVTPTTLPLFVTAATNLDNARYAGLEVSVIRNPHVGFGFTAQGALLKAYPYDLGSCLYSKTAAVGGVVNCSLQNTNLGIVSGANFFGSGTSGTNGSPGNGAGNNYNAVNNHAIPYSQAYGEIHYRSSNGTYASYGLQYLGKNNSYNQPAFTISNATLRFPLQDGIMLQGSIYNLFNVLSGSTETEYGGVPVPLVNGQIGLTNANVVGPRSFLLTLSKQW